MRQRDGLARAQDADLRQPIAAVATEPRIRRGTSADAGCYNVKTKDRCLTPTRGLWFSNPSGAAHHLPDRPKAGRFRAPTQSKSVALRSRTPTDNLSPRASPMIAGAARRQGTSP